MKTFDYYFIILIKKIYIFFLKNKIPPYLNKEYSMYLLALKYMVTFLTVNSEEFENQIVSQL